MAVLRVKSGMNTGKIFDISAETLVLGRDVSEGDKSVQVLDQGVSRKHAEIFRIGEMFFIRDLESRNGTFVNDESISEVVLRIGDQIRIGNTVLIFEDRGSRLLDSRHVMVDDAAVKAGQANPSATIQFRLTKTIGGKERPPSPNRESRNLEALVGISHIIAEEKDLSRILSRAAELIGTTLDADNALIFSLKPPGNGDSEFELLARFDRSSDVEDVGVSRSIIRDCLEYNRSVLTSDAGLDSRFNAMASVVMRGIKSVICVPIASLGKSLGVLYIANGRRAEAFTAEDLELASAVGIQLGITMQLLRMVHNSDQFFRNSIRTLVAAIDMRDPARKGNAQRVATYCMAMAKELGWNTGGIRNAWLAGMLHEIGAIPLSEQDRDARFLTQTKKNFYAKELLKEIAGLEDVLPAVVQQSERWDGSGAPEGKRGEEITPLARVLGLACEFDELLLHGGANGKEMSVKEALLKVKDSADRLFDRSTVNALLIAYRNGILFNQEAGFFETPIGA
jgi:HD-GYP domain-containing protein (c-di-GMP phosphodiesterase class II)